MTDRLRSWIRTTVPTAWAALLVWLASHGVPEWLVTMLDVPDQIVMVAAVSGTYALLRWAEPYLPPWLDRLVLGSTVPPTYTRAVADR